MINTLLHLPIALFFKGMQDAMPAVMRQIRLLWSTKIVARLFSTVITFATVGLEGSVDGSGGSAAAAGGGEETASKATAKVTPKKKVKKKKKIFGFRLFSRQDSTPVTDSVTSIQIHSVCQLFTLLIDVCPLYSSEILSGLAFHEGIVPGLWRLLPTLGPEGNMKIFLRAATNPGAEPLIEVLSLACNTAARLLLVLDDREVYVYIDTWRVLCGGWLRVFIRTCVYTYMCTCVHVHARNARVFFLACHCTLTTRMHAKQCHLATQHNRYDTEVPLSLEMLKEMSKFLNNFIFNALWHRVKAR